MSTTRIYKEKEILERTFHIKIRIRKIKFSKSSNHSKILKHFEFLSKKQKTAIIGF